MATVGVKGLLFLRSLLGIWNGVQHVEILDPAILVTLKDLTQPLVSQEASKQV